MVEDLHRNMNRVNANPNTPTYYLHCSCRDRRCYGADNIKIKTHKYNLLTAHNCQYWYLLADWGGCCCHKLSNFYFISFPQNSLFEKATGTGHKNIAYHIYQSLTVIVFSTIGPLAPKYYSYVFSIF